MLLTIIDLNTDLVQYTYSKYLTVNHKQLNVSTFIYGFLKQLFYKQISGLTKS